MFVLGCRSFEVDVAGFRRTTQGKNIKLYPSLDDGHASDGYCNPPVEVLRGVLSNWNRQGADGVQTFNWGLRAEGGPAVVGAAPAGLQRDVGPSGAAIPGQELRGPAARGRPRPSAHTKGHRSASGELVHTPGHVRQLQYALPASRTSGPRRQSRHSSDPVCGRRHRRRGGQDRIGLGNGSCSTTVWGETTHLPTGTPSRLSPTRTGFREP